MYDHKLFLSVLSEFAEVLLAPYEVELVLDELADRISAVLDLAGSGVSLARDDRLEFHTAFGSAVAAVERAQEQTQTGPCVTAFRTGEVVSVNELAAAERAQWPHYCAMAAAVGISAVASLPMRLGGQTVGVLDLYAPARRDWHEDDLAAADVMANMATVFLIHASQHRKQAELNAQLQTALDSRTTIEQAKGLLAAAHHISIDEAFERIRSFARSHHETVRDVADRIVHRGFSP